VLKVLVVDDYEPFRRVVRSILQPRNELQIVGEASDGLEAVQKAKVLRPDLILLDIDLPTLSGLHVARRLRDHVPSAKVLFLSVESSSDVVREALSLGAVVYVYKLRLASELLSGIETVLGGKQFVGGDLEAEIGENTAAQAPDETVLLKVFTRFIVAALKADKPVIAAPTKSHFDSLIQILNTEGLDVDAAIERGSFTPMEATKKLSSLIVNDLPDQLQWMSACTPSCWRKAMRRGRFVSNSSVATQLTHMNSTFCAHIHLGVFKTKKNGLDVTIRVSSVHSSLKAANLGDVWSYLPAVADRAFSATTGLYIFNSFSWRSAVSQSERSCPSSLPPAR
jgi:DNA-binding NarL/FixJ family response regulator